jgi:hypothetical protein
MSEAHQFHNLCVLCGEAARSGQRTTKPEAAQVNLYETITSSRRSVPNLPMFIGDRDGQTLFYISGPRYRGYVVPDAQREWALRNAIERFKKMEISLAHFGVPIATISIFSLDSQYSSFALTVLSITLVVMAIGRVLQRRACFGDLVAGLDRVEPLDMVGRRIMLSLLSLVATAYCSYLVWRILQAFQSNSF